MVCSFSFSIFTSESRMNPFSLFFFDVYVAHSTHCYLHKDGPWTTQLEANQEQIISRGKRNLFMTYNTKIPWFNGCILDKDKIEGNKLNYRDIHENRTSSIKWEWLAHPQFALINMFISVFSERAQKRGIQNRQISALKPARFHCQCKLCCPNPKRGDSEKLKSDQAVLVGKKVTKMPKSTKGRQKIGFWKFIKSYQTSKYPNHSNKG